ncbi:Nif3-like dinuclear metal center hexameric protein [Alkalicoccobacillus murimartini]|uniref:GTP cyclohydrolase 1 type 2 homolog n=1 Tax=Alkalicoccobacillus murimartini TaxID=171685 RepID=A0ABT9YD52_9BACI|nr:Nif3-like dinuclear metal center hexameric protein [Alkalicoccobacillus murimartini]MDQ0205558.1 dinuclear metal center YbgI/SA1388 family protein [Alkalicoccobacillus murimartini]
MIKTATGNEIIEIFEKWSPQNLAVEGDRVGLMVGTLEKPVQRVMTALDVTEAVIDEAIAKEIDLLIAHHPLLFRPVKKIDTNTTQGRIIQKALQHELTIYAAHTNLDVAEGGVNDMLSDALSLNEVKVLAPTKDVSLKKLVVFVPETHAEAVCEALGEAGAGHIGAYSHCSYSLQGTGTFRPGDDSDPFIGEVGKQEYVQEARIETVVPETIVQDVLNVMHKVHPYEEVAYDLYSLDQPHQQLGLGRIGTLDQAVTLSTLAEKVKIAFQVDILRLIGDPNKRIQRVAILGGDGNKYVQMAMDKGADVLITGDIYYHTAIDAIEDGFALLDPGHNIEKIMKKGVADYLNKVVKEEGIEATIIASEVSTDPYQYI